MGRAKFLNSRGITIRNIVKLPTSPRRTNLNSQKWRQAKKTNNIMCERLSDIVVSCFCLPPQ